MRNAAEAGSSSPPTPRGHCPPVGSLGLSLGRPPLADLLRRHLLLERRAAFFFCLPGVVIEPRRGGIALSATSFSP